MIVKFFIISSMILLWYRINYKFQSVFTRSPAPDLCSVPALELDHGVEHLLGRLADGERPHGARHARVDCGRGGVDLAHGEPGQRREDEVEEALAHADHDVLIQEQTSLHRVPACSSN